MSDKGEEVCHQRRLIHRGQRHVVLGPVEGESRARGSSNRLDVDRGPWFVAGYARHCTTHDPRADSPVPHGLATRLDNFSFPILRSSDRACQRDACSVVIFLSALSPFFTYMSSHAAQRAQRSSSVSFVAGP